MKRIKLTWLVAVVLILPQLFIVAAQIIFFQMSYSFIKESDEYAERHEIRYLTLQVYSNFKGAENGLHGYLLTGDREYFKPYISSMTRMDMMFEKLRDKAVHAPYLKAFMPELGQLLEEKRADMEKAITLEQEGKHTEALKVIKTNHGRALMEKIRLNIWKIMDIQNTELDSQYSWTASHIKNFRKVMTYTTIIHFLITGIIIWLLLRVNKMEKMVTVCAWSKTIQFNGEWMSFEEYLTRRYGVSITHGMSHQVFEELQKNTHIEEDKLNKAS